MDVQHLRDLVNFVQESVNQFSQLLIGVPGIGKNFWEERFQEF